jgi:EmrB/QacA subfamily drug resistance transporter
MEGMGQVAEKLLRRGQTEASHAATMATPRRWPALLLLCAAQLIVVLNFQIANVALPLIGAGLGFSQGALQWVVSANALAYGGCLLLAGRLADLYGHRRIFMFGLGLFALGSLACGLAPGQGVLLAARAGQGIGAALFTPATLALLADTFPEGPERNRALGIWGTAGPIGGILGLLGGGSLAAAFGWRWIFFLIVPIAVATLLAAPFAVPGDGEHHTAERPDWVGALTGTGGIVALVYGLTSVTTEGNRLIRTALPLLVGGLLLLLFVAVERRVTDPLLPRTVFRSRERIVANLVSFLHGASTNTPIFFFTLYLQQVRGQSPLETGVAFLPCNLALIVAALGAKPVIDRLGQRRAMAGGMGVVVVGLLLLARITPEGSYLTILLPGLVLWGAGLGLAQIAAVGAGTAGTTGAERGVAAGLINTGAQVGTAVGLSIMVTSATMRTNILAAGAQPSTLMLISGYRWAFVVGSLIAALGAIIALSAQRNDQGRQ